MINRKALLTLICGVTCAAMSSCSFTWPVTATSNPVGAKMGTSSGFTLFRVLAFGQDASILKAAKNGGITRISTVDMKSFDALGIFQQYTTIVSGE